MQHRKAFSDGGSSFDTGALALHEVECRLDKEERLAWYDVTVSYGERVDIVARHFGLDDRSSDLLVLDNLEEQSVGSPSTVTYGWISWRVMLDLPTEAVVGQ